MTRPKPGPYPRPIGEPAPKRRCQARTKDGRPCNATPMVHPRKVDGKLKCTLRGDRIVAEFITILDDYVDRSYAPKAMEAVDA